MNQGIDHCIRSTNYILVYLAIVAISLFISIGLVLWLPNHGYYLYFEDHFIENLGAFVLIAKFLLGIPLSIIRKKHRIALFILTVIGRLGFLVEVGFGKRWFTLEASPIGSFIVHKLHAAFSYGYYLIKRIYNSHTLVFYIVLIVLMLWTVFITVRFRHKLRGFNKWGELSQTYILAVFFIALLLAGTVIDLANVHEDLLVAIEELMELFSSLALFFCLISLYRPRSLRNAL